MLWFLLFVFGLAMGSFLNVVASRYDGDHFLFDTKMIGGRSHCTHCGKTLRWFELVPLFSFLIQGGHCRRCGARLSLQYPIMELVSALIFVFVPFAIVMQNGGLGIALTIITPLVIFSAIWVAAFEALLVMTLIDIRLGIIPDEINIFLGVLGVALGIVMAYYFAGANNSFLGAFAGLFCLQGNVWLNKIAAAVFAAAFFGFLIAVTRGRGMGLGDLKLVIPLGLLFGWPDVVLVMMVAFVIGAAVGLASIVRGKKTMKGTLPFGPFLAAGGAIVFFWGLPLFNWYFNLLGVR